MDKLNYTYSQLSSQSVAQLVTSQYDLPELTSSKFYLLGLHDNYLIECEQEKYILRIYRNDWRSFQEVQFELELLAFLGAKGAPVSFPVPTKSAKLSFIIDSAEGERSAVLFSYADGSAPGNAISIEESTQLGKVVAGIHSSTDTFQTGHNRPILDIPYLLDESIIAIKPFIDIDSLRYLLSLQRLLKKSLPSLSQQSGVYGICIGDVNPSNFHINLKKEITLFDFDQCGYGYRAFEIGKFFSSIHSFTSKQDIANAFIDGYQQVRELMHEELLAIPYYELLSVIWVMAIHANNVERIGYKYLEKPFWDRRLSILNELEKLLPA